jgi:hypothetical protein
LPCFHGGSGNGSKTGNVEAKAGTSEAKAKSRQAKDLAAEANARNFRRLLCQ